MNNKWPTKERKKPQCSSFVPLSPKTITLNPHFSPTISPDHPDHLSCVAIATTVSSSLIRHQRLLRHQPTLTAPWTLFDFVLPSTTSLSSTVLSTTRKDSKRCNSSLIHSRFTPVGNKFSLQFLKPLCAMHGVGERFIWVWAPIIDFWFRHYLSLRQCLYCRKLKDNHCLHL